MGPLPVQIEAADFNRDLNLDLAILSIGVSATQSYSQSLYVLQGRGDGTFVEPFVTVFETTETNPRFAVGDFTGDSWPDLGLLEPQRALLRIAVNERSGGTPAFTSTGMDTTVASNTTVIAAGKLDGDTYDDCVLASAAPGSGGHVAVFRSNGAGGFTQGGTGSVSGTPTCIAVRAMDTAGTPGIVLGLERADDYEACLLAGDGAGGLGDPVVTPLTARPRDLALGDLNGDAVQDLAFAQPDLDVVSTVLVSPRDDPAGLFVRGDANGEGKVDISDAVFTLGYLFLGNEPDCLEALDANDDQEINIADAVFLLVHLFRGGPPPPAPYPHPGSDPQPETLGCTR